MLQLAGTLNQEPALLSHLVRGAIVSMAVETTERCLNTTAPSEGACSLIQAFSGAVRTHGLPAALIGERASLTPLFRMSWAELQAQAETQEDKSPKVKHPPLAGHANPVLWL